MKVRNAARERLENGEMSLGVGIRTARTVDIAKMMKTAGYDWLFIDLEHGPMSIEFAATLAVAALDTGISPIVRVPFMQHTMATRVLDSGALGVVMPHVDTPEQARDRRSPEIPADWPSLAGRRAGDLRFPIHPDRRDGAIRQRDPSRYSDGGDADCDR
jgi:hypothetical protein